MILVKKNASSFQIFLFNQLDTTAVFEMENVNHDFRSILGDNLSPELVPSSMEMYWADEEFRAGYPFPIEDAAQSNG